VMKLKRKEFLSLKQGKWQWLSTRINLSSYLCTHQDHLKVIKRNENISSKGWMKIFRVY
jgi:hypothetical protein